MHESIGSDFLASFSPLHGNKEAERNKNKMSSFPFVSRNQRKNYPARRLRRPTRLFIPDSPP